MKSTVAFGKLMTPVPGCLVPEHNNLFGTDLTVGVVLSQVKAIYTGDLWRQFLTITPGVPHDISGRSVTGKKCELTPQSYVHNVTQPSVDQWLCCSRVFDSRPVINPIFSILQLHCARKS